MDSSGSEPSPGFCKLTVDGFVFSVAYDSSQPGAYHYTRLVGAPGGPAVGYGFTSRNSDQSRRSSAEHIVHIRGFIEVVDPVTGYLESGPEDDGEDDEIHPR